METLSQSDWDTLHIGRHWPNSYRQGQQGTKAGKTLEDECPCPVEPCGLVARDKIDPDCPQHAINAAKTIRSSHRAEDCPGAPA